MEPGEDSRHDGCGDRYRGRLVRERKLEQVAERNAVHVLLDEDDLVALVDDVEHRNDVRMMNPRRNASLIVEHLDELGVVGKMRMESLRGDESCHTFGGDEPS